MFIRKAISKFKADFDEPDEIIVVASGSLRSNTSSSRTTSDDLSSRHRTSLAASVQTRDDLPAIPLVDPNDNEAVTPLQRGSLFQSIQQNAIVSSNEPLPTIENGQQPESPKSSPISRGPIPVNPLTKEFLQVSALLNRSKNRTSSSPNDSSIPSTQILPPATHSERIIPEPSQQNLKTLPPHPNHKGFMSVSALLKSNFGANNNVNDFGPLDKPDPTVDLLTSLYAPSSSTTNDNAFPSTPLVEEMSESPSNSEACDRPIELTQPPVTQVSQQSRELPPYHDSVIETTSPTVINDNDPNDQHTSETKERSDPTPTTQPLPETSINSSKRFTETIIKRETSIPGEFPSDESPTSSSIQSPPVELAKETFPDSDPTFPKADKKRPETRRKPSSNSMSPFLLALATPRAAERVEETKTPWRPSRALQSIGESSDSLPTNGPSTLSPDDVLVRKMEELGKMRRMQSRTQITQSNVSPELSSQRLPQPIRTSTAPKPQLLTLQEEQSSDVTVLLRQAYIERQQDLQTQLDKALAELRDVKAENKRLTNENQSQERSISQLKISLDEIKHAQDTSSTQIKTQLKVATTSLANLTKEKKGWQDKLDSMRHKLSVAERHIRCLDHLTRHKLESRQEAAYGQPKRRGVLGVTSAPASADVIGAMSALNEEIYQACVQLVEGLERTTTHSNKHKPRAQKVLGEYLTTMLEDQATKKLGYNMLLMQAVLEVFMVHWCSSIIEAFYPNQESFADLLVQLSAQSRTTTGSTVICGKQIQIVEPSTPYTDSLKFNEWVIDIIKELGWLLMIAGLRMKPQRSPLFSTKTLALVKGAYNLRTAMAEKDISGDLEVVVVAAYTPFQEKWMVDAHGNRKGDIDQLHVDFVAGTSGIGLQRKTSENVDGHVQPKIDMELKPKVILTRDLKD